MRLFEMLERVKEAHPEKHRTRIVLDLNRHIVDFARRAKLITVKEDLFTQALVDSFGNTLTDEGGEEIVSSVYGSAFPLPGDCYTLTEIEEETGEYTYTLKENVLRFYYGSEPVTFEPSTGVSITLHYTKRPARLERDEDEPAFNEDFHDGPLYALLAEYAAVKGDKLTDYYRVQAELRFREACAYATALGRESYDVKPIQWSA